MTEEIRFDRLAHRIAEKLGIAALFRPNSTYKLDFNWGNEVIVSRSFEGRHSTPYAGRVRFDPSAPETIAMAHDFLKFLAEQSQLAGFDFVNSDPLFQLMITIVSADDASDLFFRTLTDYENPQAFDPISTLRRLNAQADHLPGASAWQPAVVEQHGQLLDLLRNLSTDEALQFAAKLKLRENRWEHVIHDHRHYLLFGQNESGIAPKAWFNAAWKFIEHFRCNFGMFITEAMLYEKVTIIGAVDIPFAVSAEEEEFLTVYSGQLTQANGSEVTRTPWRKVERLNVSNAQQLSDLLDDRIRRDVRFEGRYEGHEVPARS